MRIIRNDYLCLMITKEDYLLMKRLIQDYENGVLPDTKAAYIVSYSVNIHREYNPLFGDNRECKCGHVYYRHFDSYEGMYCGCQCFELSDSEIREDKLNSIL